MKKLCTHEATVTLVLTNYILTAVLATAFELASGAPTFGLYANHNAAWHNFGTNILAHYVFPVFALTVASRIRTVGRLTKTHVRCFLAYLLVYFVAVRLTGMLCYRIEWYPYPIFDPELLWQMLGLPAYTPALGWLLLVSVNALLALAYVGLLYAVRAYSRALARRAET